MVAERTIDEMSLVRHEDLVMQIIYELLPRFAEACGDRATVRWQCRLLIAEVDRLCSEHGPL